MPAGSPHTLKSLADFAFTLRTRCVLRDGKVAKETWLNLSDEDVAALTALQERLDQMVPHAKAIRKVVTGR